MFLSKQAVPLLMGVIVVGLSGGAIAAEARQDTSGAQTTTQVGHAPSPFFFLAPPNFPLPTYVAPVYKLPAYAPPAAYNPYLVPGSVPQYVPPAVLFPWTWFMPPQNAQPTPAASPVQATTPVPGGQLPPGSPREEASKALAQAEAEATSARSNATLWVPAETALKNAQEAAKAGDDNEVLRQLKLFSELLVLSQHQVTYPSTEILSPEEVSAAVPTPAVQVPAPSLPVLSEVARQALAQAEDDAKLARTEFVLWSPAESALKNAQEAAKEGDSAEVIKLTEVFAQYIQLGRKQMHYPSTETAPQSPASPVKPKARKQIQKKRAPASTKTTPAAVESSQTSQPATPAPGPAPAATATGKTPSTATTESSRPKPRKLCWKGDRLDVCP